MTLSTFTAIPSSTPKDQMPRPDQLNTPPQSFFQSILNASVQVLMIILIHTRLRSKDYTL
ncbi:hypothetical protein HYALB_00005868 [Hymenoscyphus albidus]|uniref:Uncharacterized protein n=1 Tax=Hymenoscyphus albidus TaxID=595503 RepID=A0A9N9LWH9_9HELO|nr:hypothetical protein HYALB_00005868 [Hymenoscyphus albidus]